MCARLLLVLPFLIIVMEFVEFGLIVLNIARHWIFIIFFNYILKKFYVEKCSNGLIRC